MTGVDDAIGAIYKALERSNQLNDTVILFQLDHGMKEKDLNWKGGIRIPCWNAVQLCTLILLYF